MDECVQVMSVNRGGDDECGRGDQELLHGLPDMLDVQMTAIDQGVFELQGKKMSSIGTGQAAPDKLPFLEVSYVGPSGTGPG